VITGGDSSRSIGSVGISCGGPGTMTDASSIGSGSSISSGGGSVSGGMTSTSCTGM